MKLNIISWNIRHLRADKVEKYLKLILHQLNAGHVMFFYEHKNIQGQLLGREFVDAIGGNLLKSKAAGSMRLGWTGYRYDVDTNEFVWIVYSSKCTTGPKSSVTEGQPFTIAHKACHEYDNALREVGRKALSTSMNETIMSDRASKTAKFRIPAVVHFRITKPDGSMKTVRIASWHAPGPAKATAPLLNYHFQRLLRGEIDLFIGDFNMTGIGPDPRVANLPMTLQRTNTSTTLTASGPVAHEEGFDLVYIDAATIAPGIAAQGTQIGKAFVSVIPKPDSVSYEEMYDLSDHLPVLVTLKSL
jgi:hypothetical protein